MELDAVVVEVVEDGQTGLVPLPVVGLGPAGPARVGPLHVVVGPAGGPGDVPSSHPASSPVEPLAFTSHQRLELSLLAGAVNTEGSHPVLSAEGLSLALSEVVAADLPANQEVLTSKLMVGTVASTTTTN